MATTYTTNYHLGKQTDHSDKFSMDVITDNMDIIDTQLKTQSDKIDAAAAGIKYKGEVNYYADLPTTGVKIGDAYTVKYAGTSGTTPDGTEYVWGTVSSTNQWINFSKDSYTKAEVDALLAGKQAALTTAQLAAVNSGIDSTKVAQIETNKNNISLLEQMNGKKNLQQLNSVSKYDVTTTVDTDGLATITGTASGSGVLTGFGTVFIAEQSGTYSINTAVTGTIAANVDIYLYDLTSSATVANLKSSGTQDITLTAGHEYNSYVYVNTGVVLNNTFKIMICPKAIADAFPDYQPYAMSNVELTEQTNTNTANILTLADSGGKKNLFLPTRTSTTDPTGFSGTITRNEDNSYTINGTTGNSVYYHNLGNITLNAGTYILYARDDITTYSDKLFVYNDGDWNDYINTEKTLSTQTTYTIFVRIEKNTTINNFTIKPMICTKAKWDISHTYQPYAMTNAEITAWILAHS